MKTIEYKATSVRLDGVFRPLRPAQDPAYLWEVAVLRFQKGIRELVVEDRAFPRGTAMPMPSKTGSTDLTPTQIRKLSAGTKSRSRGREAGLKAQRLTVAE